jgi:transcriptional regulator of acetoin/glycerol metabolism
MFVSESAVKAEALRKPEGKKRLTTAIKTHKGNVLAVAEELGVSRNTLWRLLRQHGLEESLSKAREKGKGKAKPAPTVDVSSLSEEQRTQRAAFLTALEETKGNVVAAGKALGMSRQTATRRVQEFGLGAAVANIRKGLPAEPGATAQEVV